MRKLICLISLGVGAVACGSNGSASGPGPVKAVEDAAPPPPPVRAAELGNGDHSRESVDLTVIAGPSQRLAAPRDLAFNPRRPDELWTINFTDESVLVVTDASTDGRTSEWRKDGYALHFMAKPAAIAFGADETTIGLPGTFATCGESRNTYDDTKPPNDFMGPALWSSDLTIFAKKNPNGLGSHLDMLHNSPLCVGLAHEQANIYWAVSGKTNAIVKYDFKKDNGVGNDDHSDGESYEYVRGQIKYVPGVSSHLFFRIEDNMLYIADAGNARVAKLDTTTGTKAGKLPTKEPMAADFRIDGATLADVVTADSGLLTTPSGLEIHGDYIYVSDNANGRISAFTLAGERVNWLETGLPAGALSGMAFGTDGKIYFVDTIGSQILRIDPKPKPSGKP